MIRMLALSVVLALACDLDVSAQARSGASGSPRAPVATGRSGAPVPSAPFKSTQALRPQRAQPAPFPFRGRGLVFSGLPFFWGWGAPAFYLDAPQTRVPPPGDGPLGGVQLDVTPWRSSVYVDGTLAGRVEEFKGYYQHLDLVAGPHQIMIVEPGYEPLVIDVAVTLGRTTTYRATLSVATSR